jgi:hypothetical protein
MTRREDRDDKKNAKHDQRTVEFHQMIGKSDKPVHEDEDNGGMMHDYRIQHEVELTAEQVQKYAGKRTIERMHPGKNGKTVVVFKKGKLPKEFQ